MGRDNNLENAITRAAISREWLRRIELAEAETTVIAFTWPSLGRLLDLPLPWGDYQRDQIMAGPSALRVSCPQAELGTRWLIHLIPSLLIVRETPNNVGVGDNSAVEA